MTDFEKWYANQEIVPECYRVYAKHCYLAGQASAEQRVKWQDDLIQELQAKCAELERERDQWKYTAEIRQQHLEYTIKAQASEPVGYHFSYTTPFGHVVWDIDYTPRPDAIECYPLVRAHPTTERPYNPLNDYAVISMNPTEPVKAQAGEPVAWKYCPECGCTEWQTSRFCKGHVCENCGQEWFPHIDYTDVVVRKNLQRVTNVCGFYSPDLMRAVTRTGQFNLLCFTHNLEKIKEASSGRQILTTSEPVMPSYGRIPWKDLIDAIGEATGVAWEPDDSYYIGHQPVSINMNSLNRIVSKFASDSTSELAACKKDADRYRWLRDKGHYNKKCPIYIEDRDGPIDYIESEKELDAILDGVMYEGWEATQ